MSGFAFQWPGILVLLLLAPLLAWLLAHARKRRRQLIVAMGGGLTTHRLQRDVLRLLVFVLLVLALARPGYAPRMESISHTGRDVVFALDVSQSMLAEDVPPSRLEVARQGVRDALKALRSERVGLVVYAGSASVLCPLTYDYDFVRYMLEQAQPRTVDFGGTTLQAAVEKCVDQVFMKGREGMEDLVVLTDGGDHGSQVAPTIELLDEKQVDVLLVGLGDSQVGSPIPITDADGKVTLLEDNGAPVSTRLDDSALREFAAQSRRVTYEAAGVRPFDLGQLYLEYAAGRPHEAADAETGSLVYREGAVFLLVPALLLLLVSERWGARGVRLGQAAGLALALMFPSASGAADAAFRTVFTTAIGALEKGEYEAAESQLSELYRNVSDRSADQGDLAALQFNRGLCLLKLSEAQAETAPAVALARAQEAQGAFLAAKQCAPDFQRAGVRLESTAVLLSALRQRLAEEEEKNKELNAQIEALIERLKALLESQQKLRAAVSAADVPRQRPRPAKNAPPRPPVVAPSDAPLNAASFVSEQTVLETESRAVEETIRAIDTKLDVQVPGMPPMESLMAEPLKLMKTALDAEAQAIEGLKIWDTWPAAQSAQQRAESAIEKIIELLAGNSQQDGDENDEGEEMDDEGEYESMDDSQESTTESQAMPGNLAAGSEMQELPVPNYSAEDILNEEQGSLQFRQQKRAKSNAAKVEKDY